MDLFGYNKCLCELKTETNYFLVSGYLSRVTDDYIEVKNQHGDMPIMHANLKVKIFLYNEQLGNIVVMGTVYLSTKEFARIVDICTLNDYEKRDFYRVEVLEETLVFLLHKDQQSGDQAEDTVWRIINRFPAVIIDISLGGVMLRTPRHLPSDSRLRIRLDINKTPVDYDCEIKRARQLGDDMYEYGCGFCDCSTRDMDLLSRYIFTKQRELIRRHRNN